MFGAMLISVVVGADLQSQLASIKSLGISAGRVALHPAQSHERVKRFRLEPSLIVLRPKGLHDGVNFFLAGGSVERHKNRGLSHVAVILGNLVFENQVIAKRVPSQFRQQAMILVSILASVSENYIRRDFL